MRAADQATGDDAAAERAAAERAAAERAGAQHSGAQHAAAQHAAGESSWRERWVTALGVAWQARPALLAAQLAGALVMGATPVAVVWLTKRILDELLGQQRSIGWLIGQSVLLAGLGLIAAALPHLFHYVDAEMSRSIRLHSRDRLYAALSRLTGLSRFEDPVFHDRIRLAQQAGEMSPRRSWTPHWAGCAPRSPCWGSPARCWRSVPSWPRWCWPRPSRWSPLS